jgi:hypothetical protein
MTLSEQQIEQQVEAALAMEQGALYGTGENAARTTAGDRIFQTLSTAMVADLQTAGEEGRGIDGAAR